MRQYLAIMLLLTTAAISSSNVIPLLPLHQISSQGFKQTPHKDNTFSYRHTNKNLFDLFCKQSLQNPPNIQTYKICKSLQYPSTDERQDATSNKEYNYNVEGFRTEQWHNYPRQLDRLQNYYQNNKKLNKQYNGQISEADEVNEEQAKPKIQSYSNNEILDYKLLNEDSNKLYESNSPLLVLKVRLEYLDDDKFVGLLKDTYTPNRLVRDDDKMLTDEIIPEYDATQDDNTNRDDDELDVQSKDRKTVDKRIFSLWSRLQNLGPRGHELHHRRHLHAYYGFPDEANDSLTAETRAIFSRPPGSPLRWG